MTDSRTCAACGIARDCCDCRNPKNLTNTVVLSAERPDDQHMNTAAQLTVRYDACRSAARKGSDRTRSLLATARHCLFGMNFTDVKTAAEALDLLEAELAR